MSGQGCAPSGEAAEIDLKFPGRKGQWLSPTPDIFSGGSGLILPLGSEMAVVASTSEPCTWYRGLRAPHGERHAIGSLASPLLLPPQ